MEICESYQVIHPIKKGSKIRDKVEEMIRLNG